MIENEKGKVVKKYKKKIRSYIIWDKNNSLAQNDLSTKIDWNSIQNIAKHNTMVLKTYTVKESEKVLIIGFLVRSESDR